MFGGLIKATAFIRESNHDDSIVDQHGEHNKGIAQPLLHLPEIQKAVDDSPDSGVISACIGCGQMSYNHDNNVS